MFKENIKSKNRGSKKFYSLLLIKDAFELKNKKVFAFLKKKLFDRLKKLITDVSTSDMKRIEQ